MTIDRRTMMIAAALLAGSALYGPAPSAAATNSVVPPYCVMTGGPRGPGSVPQICRFFDYRQCLEAAAVLRGNCVVNIDYHGDVRMPPVSERPRYRR
jgi:uncharacterized protein DUF3551